ncbi:MAG: hypothetical protein FWF84_07070 [Kiritimatiellaeota bacterium]|nr:hypothetical protein [Kiritimatiellota bacterium]
MLADVYVIESVAELPRPIPEGCTFVTKDGALFTATGYAELWMPEGASTTPLSRKMLAEDTRKELGRHEADFAAIAERVTAVTAQQAAVEDDLRTARRALDERRRLAAQKEGELHGCRRDLAQTENRLASVRRQSDELLAKADTGDNAKETLADRLKTLLADRDRLSETAATEALELQRHEQRYAEAQGELTEHRLKHASLSQQVEHSRSQYHAGKARLDELTRLVQGRTQGLQSYADSIQRLKDESESLKNGLPEQETRIAECAKDTSRLRATQAKHQHDLDHGAKQLQTLRNAFEETRNQRAQTEIQLAEIKMRHQNQSERISAEYHIALADLAREPEPKWDGDAPLPVEAIDKRIAELRSQMDAMGPVNLVAIDEHRELEERHVFLTAQEDDLVKAKADILEMIKKINAESSEMFRETFAKANENFQMMFAKLFNGGTAELLLIDSEDVLECGIDIIARPPGKRLQNVSLLSGGERTMTAVALLFAIYMIKPSPFALLDELDAALDDSNIGRFVSALKDFLALSQFLIITHNQHTIAGADIVYGVTMPEKGISKLVSMRLKEIGANPQ